MTVSQFVYTIINFVIAVLMIFGMLSLAVACVLSFMAGMVGFGWFYLVFALLSIVGVGCTYADGSAEWKTPQLSQKQN